MRYAEAGVDINRAERVKKQIKRLARSTFSPNVVAPLGGFGGLFKIGRKAKNGVLVSSMDGVGTKLLVAFRMNGHERVAEDLVHHCVNDILVQGARPLFFLDYLASGKLNPQTLKLIIRGFARACRRTGCALIGGETAQMPGFYAPGHYDLAGCMVGYVEKRNLLDGSRIRPGDTLLGLPSLGLHTNGYSLARKVLLERADLSLKKKPAGFSNTLGAALLAPHRCYSSSLAPLAERRLLKGMAHITGGGMTDNIPRVLPAGCRAEIRCGSWPVLSIFRLIESLGNVKEAEMYRTFNMGIGMVLVVGPKQLAAVERHLKKVRQKFYPIGTVRRGRREVRYVSLQA